MPRASPTSVVVQRVEFGNVERELLRSTRNLARAQIASRTFTGTLSALAGATAGGVLALSLVGLGLNGDIDREAIRNLTIGAPAVERTRLDGSAQVIENPLFGVPILGPLFGTGMRIGAKTAEATTTIVDEVARAASDVAAVATGGEPSTPSSVNSPWDVGRVYASSVSARIRAGIMDDLSGTYRWVRSTLSLPTDV